MAFCGVTFTEEKREFERHPTVVPAKDFDAEVDAKCLKKAMKGFGTDEGSIIDIVVNRSSAQLVQVEGKYKTMYGEDLKETLRKELKGNLEYVILGRFYERHEFQAFICRRAMKGVGTDEQALVDVICSKTNDEMKNLVAAYNKMYDRDLVKDIEKECGGDLKKILVSLASANREDTEDVDYEVAKKEAQQLFDAGEGKWGTDEAIFNKIFALRSPMQLRSTWLVYRQISGHLIFDAIEKEMDGIMKSAFLTIAQYIKDPTTYYSEVMYNSMSGVGTDDERLIRTVLHRCEIDLKTVKARFEKLHQKTLDQAIKKETRGDYEKVMLAIVMSD